jgi:NitT/TauT family transport system ATP-binding protein
MTDLKVENLSASYGELQVLRRFSFDFSEPGCYALMGPSGVGKTTLLHILAGLTEPEAGSVGGFAACRRAILFQEDRLLGHLTALSNVALVSDAETASRLLTALGLADKLHERPDNLSGGQRRRVALARCLAFGGDVLLLDEPFTGLDTALKSTVAPLLTAHGHVIFSTHDREEAALLGAEILELN